MPDRDQCTDQAPPTPDPGEGDSPFRHTFLWRVDVEDRAALLQLAGGFENCLNELGIWGADGSRMIPAMTAALADDVEALAAYSLTIERTIRGAQMHVSDAAILWFTPRWAERLAQIAVQMRSVAATARSTE